MILRYLEAQAAAREKRPRSGAFWVSEACECPRKVLLAREKPECFLPPKQAVLVRRLHGFAMERALEDLLTSLEDTNRENLALALSRHGLGEKISALSRDQVRSWGILQLPFSATREGLEVHGRVDFLVLFFDELYILEVKHTSYEGEKEVLRGGKPYPSFLVQTSFYARELSLPAYLLVFSIHGLAREFLIQAERGVTVDGEPASVGGLEPPEFAWRRLLALRDARTEDFPIREVREGLLGPTFPQDFPTYEGEFYGLALSKTGKARASVQRDGQKIRGKRCLTCPARALCYPNLKEVQLAQESPESPTAGPEGRPEWRAEETAQGKNSPPVLREGPGPGPNCSGTEETCQP